MERIALQKLIDWNNNKRKKPLIICGARQFGKTYLVKELFAKTYYKNNYSPTELAESLQLDMKPNLLTKHLNVNKARLFNEYQIDYEPVRTHAGRRITLKRVSEQRDDA